MSEEKLAAALNQMSDRTADQLEAVVKARNAPLDRRIAAILMLVSCSPIPISTATTELICTLTDPDWDHIGEKEPTDTHLGRIIASLIQTWPREPQNVAEQIAARLFRLAETTSAISDEHLDFVLRAATGQDGTWWIDWIRGHRNG